MYNWRVQIWSFFGPCFPVFSPNTRKHGPEKTRYLDHFHAVKVHESLAKNTDSHLNNFYVENTQDSS